MAVDEDAPDEKTDREHETEIEPDARLRTLQLVTEVVKLVGAVAKLLGL